MTPPLLHPDRALEQVLAAASLTPTESVPLLDALGRVLTTDAFARDDIPIADHSAMDGYALRAADTAAAGEASPVSLHVIETITAGRVALRPVAPGEASKIMTGAPVPEGADAVVPWEDVSLSPDGRTMTLTAPLDPGDSIVRRGADIRAGTRVLSAGTTLRAQEIGVLASIGHGSATVHHRPRVLVMATGDELIMPEEPLVPGKVRSSNTFTLLAQTRLAGGEAVDLGLGADRPDEILSRIRSHLPADVIITSGGSAQGDHDYTEQVFKDLGADIRFHRVAIKPGKPVLFGTLSSTLLFGLPGNPVASMVSFELFVRPVLRKMQGHRALHRPQVDATLTEALRHEEIKRTFMRGVLGEGPGGRTVRTTGRQGSSLLTSMALANALIVLELGQAEYPAGSQVRVILLDRPEE